MERRLLMLLLLLLLFLSPKNTYSGVMEHDTLEVTPTVSFIASLVVPTPVFISIPQPLPTPTLYKTHKTQIGYFSQYNQRPTDATLAYRIEVGEIDPVELQQVAGVIATESCDYIGQKIWIQVEGKANDSWLPVMVFDCSGHVETTEWMKESAILGELGYYLAEWLDVIGETDLRGQMTFECPYC